MAKIESFAPGSGTSTTGPIPAVGIIEMTQDTNTNHAVNGNTITIFDGATSYVFEFRVSGSPSLGHIAVAVVAGSTAANLASAINASGANVIATSASPTDGGLTPQSYVISITSKLVGTAGNVCTLGGAASWCLLRAFGGGSGGYSLVDAQHFEIRPHGLAGVPGATWEIKFRDSTDTVQMRLGWLGDQYDYVAGSVSDAVLQAGGEDQPFMYFGTNTVWTWVFDNEYPNNSVSPSYHSIYWGPTTRFNITAVFSRYIDNIQDDQVSDIISNRINSNQLHTGNGFKTSNGYLGNTPVWTRYTLALSDLQAFGATTGPTAKALCSTLWPGHLIERLWVRVITPLAGPSLSAASATVGITSNGSELLGASSMTAAAETLYKVDPDYVDFTTQHAPTLYLNLTGCNFSALTAGSVEVYIKAVNLLDG